MTAPAKPWAQVHSEFQAKLTTKSGIARGTTTSTAQTRRPGRSVRSTHHAAPVPITAHAAVTTTVSRTVFHSRVRVSGRKMRCATSEAPAPWASTSRNTSGRARSAATRALMISRATGRSAGRSGRGLTVLFSPGRVSVPAAISGPDPSGGSQQAGLAQQGDRRRAVAELGDRDRGRLKLIERRLRCRGRHAVSQRVLVALLVARGTRDDLLTLLAGQEGEEFLGRRLMLARLQHGRTGDVDHVSGVVRGEVSDLRVHPGS